MRDSKAILALADGTIFEGKSIGAIGEVNGEIVFNTSMSGYQEILTDPSYAKQIVTLTYPHIGNTGTNPEDTESEKIWSSGLVIRSISQTSSNWRNNESLSDYLKRNNVLGISDIDTRHLTKILRDEGCKIGAIYPTKLFTDEEANSEIKKFGTMDGKNFTENVAVIDPYAYGIPKTKNKFKIVAVDFGIKENILRIMKNMGGDITVVPPSTTAKEIEALKPDGIFLSNGPGDPKVLTSAVDEVKEMMQLGVPIFGICLGHQIMSLAYDLKIEKMPFGHHGANHPVHDLKNNTVFITSQNHNFAVADVKGRNDIVITHKSLFDGSIQGIEHKEKPFYSIQCHPEASPGPKEFEVLFKRFFEDMNA